MRMLVAVDVEDRAEALVEAAVPWARQLGASISLVSASEWLTRDPGALPEPTDQLLELRAQWAERAQRQQQRLDDVSLGVPFDLRGQVALRPGRAVDALPEALADYDLGVLGTHARRGLQRILLGSVTARLLRETPTPLLVLGLGDPPRDPTGPLHIVAPIDDDPAALRLIASWFPDARVELVHVLPTAGWSPLDLVHTEQPPAEPSKHRAAVANTLTEQAAQAGLPHATVHVIPREGANAGDQIATWVHQQQADLVVLPTHGRGPAARAFLGSVAERVADRAPCPVLVLPPQYV